MKASALVMWLCSPVALAGVAGPGGVAGCPPPSHDRAALQALKASGYELRDAGVRASLALALVACLSDPDPALRDGIAYEALAHWLQRGALGPDTRTTLRDWLVAALRAEDADGFRRPFAALVLSELVAGDVAAPWMTPAQRSELLAAASDYLAGVRDYRGFDQRAGWRHGVAHGADLLLQLARHPQVDRAGLDRILAALAVQVAPDSGHAYIDGESERLARAVLYVALRGEHDAAAWERWFVALAGPGPLASWDEAFRSRAGLARRHNLLAFLRAAYEGAREGGDAKLEVLLPGLRAAFKLVP